MTSFDCSVDENKFNEIILGIVDRHEGKNLDNLKADFAAARKAYNKQPWKWTGYRESPLFFAVKDSDQAYEAVMKLIDAAIAHRNNHATQAQKVLLYQAGLVSRFDSVLNVEDKLNEQQQIALILRDYFDTDKTKGGDNHQSMRLHVAAQLTNQTAADCLKTNNGENDGGPQLCEAIKSQAKDYCQAAVVRLVAGSNQTQTDNIGKLFTELTLDKLFRAFEAAEASYKAQPHLKFDFKYHLKDSVQHWTRFSQLIAECNIGNKKLMARYSLDNEVILDNGGRREITQAEQCLHILGYYFDASTPGGTDAKSMKLHVLGALIGCDVTGMSDADAQALYQAFMTPLMQKAGGMTQLLNLNIGENATSLWQNLGLQFVDGRKAKLAETQDALPYLQRGRFTN